MIKKSLLSAIVFVASISLVGTASAQNSAFEGFYVGAQAGWSSIDGDLTVTGVGSGSDTADGFGGGGYVGFGGTNGKLYGGIEAELGYDGAEWDDSFSVPGIGSASAEIEAQLTFGLGFRVGWLATDNILIYGRGAWIRTNAELNALVSLTGIGSVSVSVDEDFDGFRFGGGVEGKLGDNIGVRGEYTYTLYGDVDIAPGVNFDADQHLFRVGVAYYF